MNYCENCNKRIFFWNKFYRKYGKGIAFWFDDERKKETSQYIYFCSDECYKECLKKNKQIRVVL